jgi:hypothetical protein
MKKFFTSVLLLSVVMSVFAVSYTNNTYQKLANEYAKKAEMALDAGHYDESVEFSRLAEENAILSREYTEMMLARKDAEDTNNIRLSVLTEWTVPEEHYKKFITEITQK